MEQIRGKRKRKKCKREGDLGQMEAKKNRGKGENGIAKKLQCGP